MSSNSSHSITIFLDDCKLNNDNFSDWLDAIVSLIRGKGLEGYLTGTIPRPQSTFHPPMIIAPSPVPPTLPTSPFPSVEEWTYQEGYVASLLYQNILNPKAHGIRPMHSALHITTTLDAKFRSRSKVGKIRAMKHLQDEKFTAGNHLLDHLDQLAKL